MLCQLRHAAGGAGGGSAEVLMAQADPQIWGSSVEDRHVGTGQVRGVQKGCAPILHAYGNQYQVH